MGGRGASFAVSPVAPTSGAGLIGNVSRSAYARRAEISPNRGSNNARLRNAVRRTAARTTAYRSK